MIEYYKSKVNISIIVLKELNRDIFEDNKRLCSDHTSHIGWQTSSRKYAKYLKTLQS